MDDCRQEGSPIVVCVAADPKEPLTEDTIVELLCCEENTQGCPIGFHFMKHLSLHN